MSNFKGAGRSMLSFGAPRAAPPPAAPICHVLVQFNTGAVDAIAVLEFCWLRYS